MSLLKIKDLRRKSDRLLGCREKVRPKLETYYLCCKKLLNVQPNRIRFEGCFEDTILDSLTLKWLGFWVFLVLISLRS